MRCVQVTATGGAGKSALARRLRALGHHAVSTDGSPDLCRWVDHTGAAAIRPGRRGRGRDREPRRGRGRRPAGGHRRLSRRRGCASRSGAYGRTIDVEPPSGRPVNGEVVVMVPIGAQPRRARGTVERPYSALNLRLALASFGLVAFTALTIGLAVLGLTVAAVASGIIAATAVVDIIVIQKRRHQRAYAEAGRHHSLFE